MKLANSRVCLGKLPPPQQWQGQWRQCEFQPGLPEKFAEKDHQLNFTSSYSLGGSDGESYFSQESEIDSLIRNQQNLRRQQPQVTFPQYRLYLADYTQSHIGSRCAITDELQRQYQCILQPRARKRAVTCLTNISNIFGYKDATYTGFMTFSQKTDLWGLRAGLRVTDYNQEIDQISVNRDFSVHFLTLVPSLALTSKLGESSQVKLNYSRRVQRPEADWLNPYTDVSDPRNVKSGNP
jgi:outer membrane receptor protein involved in Fe transport